MPNVCLICRPYVAIYGLGMILSVNYILTGWPQEKISETVGINQQRISQITNNTNFSEIGNLLSQGHDMEYIARHYHMDLALVWALRLEGKTDQAKFIKSFLILARQNTKHL